MEDVERYLRAGTRENTRRGYQSAIEHFEVTWGGFLPATSDGIARYLAHYAGSLALSTLKQRLAALAQWHISQGFPDPTKAPLVRQVLKGIRAVHPGQAKQAQPLPLQHLEQTVQWLEQTAESSKTAGDISTVLRCRRDIALLLIGFWRGFRSDELCRVQIEHVRITEGVGMQIYLAHSKSDRQNQGQLYQTPALKRLCPVQAYQQWISEAGLREGPVFRRINRWGQLGKEGLHPGSLIAVLSQSLQKAGVPEGLYTSHSLRRGFATWAAANGWDIKALMSYVGWKDLKSAMRYIDPTLSFGGLALRTAEPLPASLALDKP